ncbi:hypothetical protein [Corallococcus sp. EGB]|uniref:hypothetical protein n=1 Tax=Corallococcus sp. EGB TaxID=1521117 RepID=UPI001CBC2D31|nr:hypothetical protein [Corallococcus sp. EGB]
MRGCDDRRAKQAMAALFEKGQDGLDAEGFRRLRAHLGTCSECQEAYTRLSRVESVLEQRALPSSRSALLEQALFARLQPAPPVVAPERKKWFASPLFMPLALSAAAVGVALVVVAPTLERQPQAVPEWQARSSSPGERAWGVRAFCIAPAGTVLAEARPGGTLTCAEGNAVQFSYTAPERVRLSLEGLPRSGGEPLRFFPREGPAPEVAAGVDVPLPFSTPVQGGWLTGPVPVRARFTDAQGHIVADTQVTLTPR